MTAENSPTADPVSQYCRPAAAYVARVIAVVSTDEKAELARSAGAHEFVRVGRSLDEVRTLTDGRGVDLWSTPSAGIASRKPRAPPLWVETLMGDCWGDGPN
ncbi:zinc-binding dehydrogenase [Streptomyces canus]|uniref:zinc-binding dehydrogenase n=1 Tax=Streptomyces canus TaxID=58343 RepID=UPI0033BF8BD1